MIRTVKLSLKQLRTLIREVVGADTADVFWSELGPELRLPNGTRVVAGGGGRYQEEYPGSNVETYERISAALAQHPDVLFVIDHEGNGAKEPVDEFLAGLRAWAEEADAEEAGF